LQEERGATDDLRCALHRFDEIHSRSDAKHKSWFAEKLQDNIHDTRLGMWGDTVDVRIKCYFTQ